MRKAIFYLLTAFFAINVPAQNRPAVIRIADDRVEAIRKLSADADARIAEMTRQPEFSSVFVADLDVNKHSAPYPAVGIFRRTSTFFYTYANREKDPYPNRLLKIAATYQRSGKTNSLEYYFDAAGQLVFAFSKSDDSSSRFYFATGRLIKLIDEDKNTNVKTRRAIERGMLIKKEASRLASIFHAALADNF